MKPKRLLALGVLLVGVTAAASLTGAQKSALPQPTEQQKLKERVDALESQLKEAQAKADRAAMEKDYILRTQNHYESYYKEVLSTQTHILWTIGITATLLSITLTAVFFVAGRFGFNIFDRKIDSALRDATVQLRTEFAETLGKETRALREANAAQLKDLEAALTKRITQQEEDLKTRSDYQFHYVRGVAALVDKRYAESKRLLRQALAMYKSGRDRHLLDAETGARTVGNLFSIFKIEDEANGEEDAKKELADELYNDLEDELTRAADKMNWLAPLLKERK